MSLLRKLAPDKFKQPNMEPPEEILPDDIPVRVTHQDDGHGYYQSIQLEYYQTSIRLQKLIYGLTMFSLISGGLFLCVTILMVCVFSSFTIALFNQLIQGIGSALQ